MVWMKSFCFCCSVRLGVIVCGIISIIHAFICWIILVIFGLPILDTAKYFITREEQFSEDMVLWKMMKMLSDNGELFMGIFQSILISHTVGTALAIYGALKLRKWFLVPFAISQTLLAFGGVAQHVITLMVLKNIVGLEVLIGSTLMGTFFICFLTYSVVTAITMFQIIVLVNSEEYKALYGNDPFAPRRNFKVGRRAIRDVNIFFVPHKKEVTRVQEMISKQREEQTGPKDEKDDTQNVDFSNWHLNEVVCVGKGLK